MKILLAGGGTGGHVIPALAVAAAVKDKIKNVELLYIGSHLPSDRELVEAAGIEFQAISAGKLRRYFSVQNAVDVFKFALGIKEAGNILRDFRPDVVFAKGGYVALPVVIVAKRLNIPVLVHESDSRLGLANRLALPSTTKIAVAFPLAQYIGANSKLIKYRSKFIYTGLPIAQALLAAKSHKFFTNHRPVILVTGGSQGAQAINKAIWQILPELLNKYNVIHQTGKLDFPTASKRKKDLPAALAKNYLVMDFGVDTFRSALKSADVVVSRAGSFIFELQVLAKPAILIPLSGSASDHQRRNARWLVEQGAALALDQRDLTPVSLQAMIEQVLGDNQLRASLSAAMRTLGTMNITASKTIADLLIKLGNEK